jgi:CRISPR-associated protein (TIGR03984 family)
MASTTTTLYSYQAKDLTFAEAISACGDQLEGAISLLYSPSACRLLKLVDGEFQDAEYQSIKDSELMDVFEARVFTEDCELRWVNYKAGRGPSVLLSPAEQTVKQFTLLEAREYEILEQKYLLWGKKAKNQPSQEGWQRLSEARIGNRDIPYPEKLTDEQRICLITHEYMAELIYQGKDREIRGNYTIIEERLVKLQRY